MTDIHPHEMFEAMAGTMMTSVTKFVLAALSQCEDVSRNFNTLKGEQLTPS